MLFSDVVFYVVMRNLDAIIRVSNYVRLNPGLQRARPLWSGASNKLIMPILPAQRKFMLLSMAGKYKTWTPGPWTPSVDPVHGPGPSKYGPGPWTSFHGPGP